MTWLPIILSGLALFVSILGYWDTHRVANHTLDSSLRPVILAGGYLDWTEINFIKASDGSISGTPLAFSITGNIAQDIEGYIVKDGKKYELLFGNSATDKLIDGTDTPIRRFVKQWAWIPAGSTIYAVFDPSVSEVGSGTSNEIYLQYKDIEGNPYHLTIDSSYMQRSKKGTR
jgi:hypothetical protein